MRGESMKLELDDIKDQEKKLKAAGFDFTKPITRQHVNGVWLFTQDGESVNKKPAKKPTKKKK